MVLAQMSASSRSADGCSVLSKAIWTPMARRLLTHRLRLRQACLTGSVLLDSAAYHHLLPSPSPPLPPPIMSSVSDDENYSYEEEEDDEMDVDEYDDGAHTRDTRPS